MTTRFSVLGPVDVTVSGRPVAGLAPRHRAVLAYLLLHAGKVISPERLTAALWADSPPDTSRSQIHAAMTTIRRVLRSADLDGVLETRTAGYVLSPPPGAFDLAEFGDLLDAAQQSADHETAADRLREALALWPGDALIGVSAEYAPGARARLEERRLAAVERLAEVELALGRHEALTAELAAWVSAYPLRERLAGQLMRALHASGRQADALAAGRRYRESLAEQQGLDPGRSFLQLEQEILRDQPVPPAKAPVRGANFLPYDVPDFTGRAVELDRILRGPGSRVCVVDGMAGVGKTTLVVHAAHRFADRYAEGQLFVDLRAHTAGQAMMTASDALHVLLRQLGLPADHIPLGETERAALWRTELANRSVLVVLDNAADAEHVRPLLPGATRSLLLITSRRRLTDLDGAYALSLDVLPASDAITLFSSVVGDRARNEYAAAGDVLRLCGHLPLAVRIAAARLHHRPQWTVAYLADRLRDERRRLAELATGERGVAAAFNLSYQQLPPSQQRMFRLLGLHPGRDVETHAAAALADVDPTDAEADLEHLLDSHMLTQHEPGRYTFHDLLREHARATGAATDDETDRQMALTRLFDFYLHTAAAAIDVLYPDSKHRRPEVPRSERRFTDTEATAWLDAERTNLTAVCAFAADHNWPTHATNLATTLYRYLFNNVYDIDARTTYTAALAAGRRTGDHLSQSRALSDLGWLSFVRGGYADALDLFGQAIAQALAAGDETAQARAQHGMASVHQQRRNGAEALRRFTAALELFRGRDDRFGQAVTLNSLGALHEQAGHFAEALDALTRAREVFRSLGTDGGEADVLNNLGLVHRRQGRLADAHHCYRLALETYRESGIRRSEARSLNGLAAVAADAGDRAAATSNYQAALALAVDLGDRLETARAHEGLAHLLVDRSPAAHDHARQALDLYAQLGEPEPVELRTLLAGNG
ncbi:AfsR/SARP family transcriptional regulator [Hamadaea sp.]|uniref:AfsR/SARP family transcriptional regulator n=1 Tax=Hamadaea sp. TaxID=2024425 RepID=UPI0025C582CA|nr:AfsR/SARP family transcriptional regulator [Hamadaea sp.]